VYIIGALSWTLLGRLTWPVYIIGAVSWILLGRLTWLVYIIGAVIGGRVSFASTDEHDEMDGELVCRFVMSPL